MRDQEGFNNRVVWIAKYEIKTGPDLLPEKSIQSDSKKNSEPQ